MSGSLLRLALLIYPSAWRERYGSELEQLVLDLTADGCSLRDSTRLVADIAFTGVSERLARRRTIIRAGSVVTGCALMALLCGAVSLSGSAVPNAGAPIVALSNVRLTSSTVLAPGVTVVEFPSWGMPLNLPIQPKHIQVQLAPPTDRVVAVSGPPSETVINPRTDTIVSIRPLPQRRGRAAGR